jgi:hypothetical protein
MRAVYLFLICPLFLAMLNGCGIGGMWMNGDPSVGRNLKPYGAHWVKEGMTRESRLQDYESCGGNKRLNPGFPDAVIRAETLSTDTVSAQTYNKDLINNPQAEARLGKKRMFCMLGKGYVWLENCDARCLYP